MLAAAVNTYAPQGVRAWSLLHGAAKSGLTATLFLIGAGLNRQALGRIGPRPLIQGVALWALVGGASLAMVRAGFAF